MLNKRVDLVTPKTGWENLYCTIWYNSSEYHILMLPKNYRNDEPKINTKIDLLTLAFSTCFILFIIKKTPLNTSILYSIYYIVIIMYSSFYYTIYVL